MFQPHRSDQLRRFRSRRPRLVSSSRRSLSRRRPHPWRLEPAGRAKALVRHRCRDVPDLLLHVGFSLRTHKELYPGAGNTKKQGGNGRAARLLSSRSLLPPSSPCFRSFSLDLSKAFGILSASPRCSVGVIIVAIVVTRGRAFDRRLMAMKNKMAICSRWHSPDRFQPASRCFSSRRC